VSGDGALLIAAGGKSPFGRGRDRPEDHLWAVDLNTRQLLWSKQSEKGDMGNAPLLTPDGKTLLTASLGEEQFTALDARTGEVRWTLPLEKHGSCTSSLSPDGSTLILSLTQSSCYAAHTFAVDVASGEKKWELHEGWHPRQPVVSPDGLRVYLASDGKVEERSLKTGNLLWTQPVELGWQFGCHPIQLSPDGSLLAVPGDGATHLYDVDEGVKLREIPTSGQYDCAIQPAFTPDGASLLTKGLKSGIMRTDLLDAESKPELIHASTEPVRSLTVGPKGRWLYLDGYGEASAIELKP
jgi:WD40 repeat protein